jgi:hypothetical protein
LMPDHHIRGVNLELDDEQAVALIHSRYPFSPRIRVLREILAKLRPEPVREPLPPPKHHAPEVTENLGALGWEIGNADMLEIDAIFARQGAVTTPPGWLEG